MLEEDSASLRLRALHAAQARREAGETLRMLGEECRSWRLRALAADPSLQQHQAKRQKMDSESSAVNAERLLQATTLECSNLRAQLAALRIGRQAENLRDLPFFQKSQQNSGIGPWQSALASRAVAVVNPRSVSSPTSMLCEPLCLVVLAHVLLMLQLLNREACEKLSRLPKDAVLVALVSLSVDLVSHDGWTESDMHAGDRISHAVKQHLLSRQKDDVQQTIVMAKCMIVNTVFESPYRLLL